MKERCSKCGQMDFCGHLDGVAICDECIRRDQHEEGERARAEDRARMVICPHCHRPVWQLYNTSRGPVCVSCYDLVS